MAISDIPGDIEQTRRRQAGSLQAGIGLSPEQLQAQRRQVGQQRLAETLTSTRANAGQVLDRLGNSAANVAKMPAQIAVEGTKQIGGALGSITFDDSLPDYSSPAKEAEKQRRAAGWVEQNPERAAQAKIQMQGMADRAVQAGLGRPAGFPMRAPSAGPAVPEAPASAAPGAAGADTIGGASPETRRGDAPAQQADQLAAQGQWGGTGIGVGRQGGEIVGRVNADGVAEFSNMGDAQQAATGRQFSAAGLRPQRERVEIPALPGEDRRAAPQGPAGARMLASGSSVRSDAEAFADRGSAANVGRGLRGYLSQGAPGDAQKALAIGERANQERAKTIQMLKKYEPTGVRGVRGPMSLDEIAQEKLGLRSRAVAVQEAEQRQRGIDAGLERGLRERELAGTEKRTRQELEAGELSLAQQRRVADIYARYEQAAPEERAALAEQIRTLTGKEAPNRFTVVPGGQEYDASAGALVNRPASVFNNQTGQFVDQGELVEHGGSKPDGNAAGQKGIAEPTSKAEYDALPKGAQYMKDGQIRIKS